MEEETKTEQKVKLNRGMTGNYGWEITVLDKEFDIETMKKIDQKLRKTYIEKEDDEE